MLTSCVSILETPFLETFLKVLVALPFMNITVDGLVRPLRLTEKKELHKKG